MSKIKKYKLFISESKLYDYVKYIMVEIRDQIKNFNQKQYYLDFNENYGITFYINIDLNIIKNIPVYNSNISVKEILDKEFNNFSIDIYIEDENIKPNKFFSLIAHEISHVYQLISADDTYFDSFNKMKNIENFKKSVLQYKKDFLDYIYMNFQHELDARVNQTYEANLYNNKFSTFEEVWNNCMNTDDVYKDIVWLGYFNYNKELVKYNQYNILELTNQFNLLYGIENITIEKIKNYYDNWSIIFKQNSIEYITHLKDAIYQAFNNIKRYENNIDYCYYSPALLEEINKYDPDIEILKLVEKFKKLDL